MTELPTGTVTFLFTDVEGSTKLLHELGAEAYDEALITHRSALREAFQRHGGVEVDTQGDAFFYAFPTAPGAVDAAREGMEALSSGPIRVRVGLHTGTPHIGREGYIGDDVHLGARIAATAHGGQVVLSRETRVLVDSDITDLGEHRLKDIPQAVPIYQLGDGSFPPLKTISNTNLPTPASSFVGRDDELLELLSRFEDGARLVTLTGPGGTGKTRLAIEAAAALVPEYKAGVFWVGLATLRDPALVPETIAQTLGAKDGLAEHIGERELLLLLDNLEQVMEAAPKLSKLLEHCPNLTLLVTSRELLRVQGEVEYAVPPLAEPDAVSLFCERAQAEPSEEISELCIRLDSLPLAVELAAARTKALSPSQILERLSQRLDLLKGGRDADPRQQTLRATIEWSYELLSPEEQQLFVRLSVFAGCTLEAAEEVADADVDTLQSLVEKSLLRFTDGRYWMLETIRAYAVERLAESGDTQKLWLRHANWCLAIARAREGVRTEEAFDELDEEQSNFRAVLDWMMYSEPTGLVELTGLLWGAWLERGHVVEARHRLDEALLIVGLEPSPERARLLAGASWAALWAGDRAKARAFGEELLAAARSLDSPERMARAVNFLGALALEDEDVEQAVELHVEVVAICREHRLDFLPHAVYNLGVAWDAACDSGHAEAAFSEALRLFRAAGDSAGIARSTLSLGGTALLAGRGEDARALIRDGLRQLASPQASVVPSALVMLSLSEAFSGESNRALRLLAAVESANEARGIVLEAQHQRRFDEARSIVTADLGPEEFDLLWSEGRALTLDEAVEYALTDID